MRRPVSLAPRQHGPGDARGLVGLGDGDQPRRSASEQPLQPAGLGGASGGRRRISVRRCPPLPETPAGSRRPEAMRPPDRRRAAHAASPHRLQRGQHDPRRPRPARRPRKARGCGQAQSCVAPISVAAPRLLKAGQGTRCLPNSPSGQAVLRGRPRRWSCAPRRERCGPAIAWLLPRPAPPRVADGCVPASRKALAWRSSHTTSGQVPSPARSITRPVGSLAPRRDPVPRPARGSSRPRCCASASRSRNRG
jgi:hypothetical protein